MKLQTWNPDTFIIFELNQNPSDILSYLLSNDFHILKNDAMYEVYFDKKETHQMFVNLGFESLYVENANEYEFIVSGFGAILFLLLFANIDDVETIKSLLFLEHFEKENLVALRRLQFFYLLKYILYYEYYQFELHHRDENIYKLLKILDIYCDDMIRSFHRLH